MENIDISVVIPCYNESDNIPQALKKTSSYLSNKGLPGEIIVVDDGSTDETSDTAKQDSASCSVRIIRLNKNSGKGAAVRAGVLESSGKLVLFTDADFSTDIHELDKLLPHIGVDYDIVIGSRDMPSSILDPPQPFHRRAMGFMCRTFVRMFLLKGFRDTQCGFKLFTCEAAQKIFKTLKTDGFAFDIEVLMLARKYGFRTAEIGVTWKDTPTSSINPVADSFRFLFQIIKLKITRN